MGFMDKMKAANGLNLGHIESPDFPCGVLIMKDKQLTIINGAMNGTNYEKPIKQSEINVFKLIGCGGTWAKYYLEFKDGKSGVITQDVVSDGQRQNGTSVSMAPIERFIKYTDFTPMLTINEKAKEEKRKVCLKCGSPIDDDMFFCGECGAKLK